MFFNGVGTDQQCALDVDDGVLGRDVQDRAHVVRRVRERDDTALTTVLESLDNGWSIVRSVRAACWHHALEGGHTGDDRAHGCREGPQP